MNAFADRLAERVTLRKSPVVVGLDPRPDQLPESLRVISSDGPAALANAYREFCRAIIDVVAPLVAVVKPQLAFFEQLGPSGMSALADIVEYARQQGLLVIADGKRNDIGSTAAAYAEAYLSESPSGVPADALTVSPYLGGDSLDPFVGSAKKHRTGIFVLVKTSNPGGGMLQDLVANGKRIYMHVAERVQRLAAESIGDCGYGAIGAVVGATYPEQLEELRGVMHNAWILVPGFGAQGGTVSDVVSAFDDRGLGAVINSSRAIIFAYNRPEYERFKASDWQRAVEQATRDMNDQLRADSPAGRL